MTAATISLLLVKKTRKKKKISLKVKPWLGKRPNPDIYETLVQEIKFEDN